MAYDEIEYEYFSKYTFLLFNALKKSITKQLNISTSSSQYLTKYFFISTQSPIVDLNRLYSIIELKYSGVGFHNPRLKKSLFNNL